MTESPAEKMTLREIKARGGKARLNGHVWEISHVNLDGKTIDLIRWVRVEAHWRRNRYIAGGRRWVAIRRPIDAAAELA